MIDWACCQIHALELARRDLRLRLSLHIGAMSLGEQFFVLVKAVMLTGMSHLLLREARSHRLHLQHGRSAFFSCDMKRMRAGLVCALRGDHRAKGLRRRI